MPPQINFEPVPTPTPTPSPSDLPSSPSPEVPLPMQEQLQDTFAQLTRVIQQMKLARVLNAQKKFRRKYNHCHWFESPPKFTSPESFALLIAGVNHIYDNNGKRMTLDQLLHSEQAERWNRGLSNELGRLTQSNDAGVRCTDAMDFIYHHEVPQGANVTYANFVMDYRPLKSDPWRVRLVVGGDKLQYDYDPGSPAASLLETKLLINSVISDAHKGARFMSADLKDHFLASPMPDAEYMRIPEKYLPQDIIDRYKLHDKIYKGYVYCKIKKGMYGLKQAALLAFNFIKENLAPHGYEPIPHTDGLWRHKTRPITFCLCVDDFGIKYFNKEDVEHLLSALRENYASG